MSLAPRVSNASRKRIFILQLLRGDFCNTIPAKADIQLWLRAYEVHATPKQHSDSWLCAPMRRVCSDHEEI